MESAFTNLLQNRQLRLILIVFAVLSGLLALAYFAYLRTDYIVLYNGLRAADASAVVAQLDAKGVDYRLRDGGTTILVPEDAADSVRLQVAGSEATAKGLSGFELFNKSDMGLTDFAQKINYQRALQGELARTIMMMDGIADARVHLALPERSLFRGNRTEPKAAVALTMQSGAIADEARVAGIQRLVAAAVPDLELTDVVVLDELGRVISYSSQAESSEPPIVEEQSAVQQYFRARARAAVEDSTPGLKFDVRVVVVPQADIAVASVLDGPASSARSAATARQDYSVRIMVVTAHRLAADEQLAIHNSIATAVGLEPANGDSVEFAVGPITPLIPGSPLRSTKSSAGDANLVTTHDDKHDLSWPMWASGLAIIAVMILIAVLGLGRNSGLLQEDREAFVLRIRRQLGLSEDEGNV